MLTKFNYFLIGIFVSGIGSLPLGYLNLIALQLFIIYQYQGLFLFIMGIFSVEIFVIIFTFLFTKQLLSKPKLFFLIDVFTILFFIFLAFSFLYVDIHAYKQNTINQSFLPIYLEKVPIFWVGFLLNLFNFLQIPYWASWHIFLIQSKKLNDKISIFYLIGTGVGTFLGMFIFVMLLHYFLDFGSYLILD
ncbi:MAG: hypothetical protein EAZ85_11395 [Bacteroidetes bacterium]|nr:MAG: hypothetical protein EAZ85_11395 [Bacteroidota bacterium]TAG92187.1 MAG: hypothetical protein EAZ20_02690 [Bacteroidota bacterium]